MNPLEDPRFQCVQLLGQGSFGRVYEAYDTWLKRMVAIKCLDGLNSSELSALRLLAGHKHSQLVEIHDVLIFQDNLYILMDYIPGSNLKVYCQNHGLLDRWEALRLFREILEVLSWLHQLGIVYNDLKPENIMRLPNGHYCLIDIGACFLMEDTLARRYGSVLIVFYLHINGGSNIFRSLFSVH